MSEGRRGHKIVAGLVLGSFFYLLVSCYIDHGLHKPKFERRDFQFNHKPWREQ